MFSFNKEKYEALFVQWKKERPEYDNGASVFIRDGIVVKAEYCAAKPRILFLMKETYDDYSQIESEDEITPSNGGSKLFWRKVNIIKHVVERAWSAAKANEADIPQIKDRKIRGFALVDIKKSNEGKKVTNRKELLRYAERDALFLRQQIEILDPQVIACCGTGEAFTTAISENPPKNLTRKVACTEKRLVFYCSHPSYWRESYNQLFSWLSESIVHPDVEKEILRLRAENS